MPKRLVDFVGTVKEMKLFLRVLVAIEQEANAQMRDRK